MRVSLAIVVLLAAGNAASQEEGRCLPSDEYLRRLAERAGEDQVTIYVQDEILWVMTLNPHSESWTLGTQRAGKTEVCVFQVGKGIFPPKGEKV